MASDTRLSDAIDLAISKLRPKDIYTDKAHNFKASGDRLRGGCPWHNSKSGTSFVVTQSTMEWYCAGCSFGGGPAQYLHRLRGGNGNPRAGEFIDLAKEICRKASVDFPEKEITPEEQERYTFLSQRSALLGNIIDFCQGQIKAKVYLPHRDYLHHRGFTDDDITELQIGFYDVAALKNHLIGYNKKLLAQCGVLQDRLNGYLVFPWYDDRKRPLTLYFKWTSKTPPEGKPKTTALSNPKLDGKEVLESKYVPYCFDRTFGCKDLVLVEGVTDAALAQVRGDRRVIACVAAQLSKGQADTLKRHGIQSVTICLDPDKAGENGIISCVRSLEEAGIKPLIAPRLLDGLDPDEFIIKSGLEPWKAHIGQAKTPLQWEIDSIAAQKLNSFDLGDCLKSVAENLCQMEPIQRAGFLDYLKKTFKENGETIKAICKQVQTKAKELEATVGKVPNQHTSLESLHSVRRIHPAIDFHEGFMTLGFRVDQGEEGDGLLLVVADSGQVRALVNPEQVECGGQTYRVKRGNPPFISDTWDLNQLRAFIQNPMKPDTLYPDVKNAFRKYLDLPDSAYGLTAAWIVGTYFSQLFTAYPFLHFFGPKLSGKTKTLEAERCVCFNGWKGRDISAAALGDTCDGLRGTILLDQAETLGGDSEQDKIIGLLADSYKKAGARRRVVEITKAGRSVLEFSCYGPKAFASTKQLDPDLSDRCIRIKMTRTRKKLPDLEGWEPIWAELRDKLYRFTLTSFGKVWTHYVNVKGDGTRIKELWRPLQAVLLALSVEQPEIDEVRTLFMAGAEENQHELTAWEQILFDVLKQRAEGLTTSFEMTGDDILSAMNIQGESKPGNKWVGETLSEFSLHSKKLNRRYAENSRTRKVTPYQFDSAHILRLYEIYLREAPLNDVSHVSQAENECDSDDMNGTDENPGTRPGVSQVSQTDGNRSHSSDDTGQVGHNSTCPTKNICPAQADEIITDSDVGQVGHTKSEGIHQNNLCKESVKEVFEV